MSFMSLFTANLSLIIAILWCFCNGLIYSLPCYYAALFCQKRKVGVRNHGNPMQSNVRFTHQY